MKNKELTKVTITAILVAVSIVLDIIISSIPGLNLSMPFGGKFFGISVFPLIIIGLLFGLKYGLIGGFVYALYNFSFDYLIYISTLKATLESWTGTTWSAWHIMALILFDYLIPFMAYGLSGLFKKDNFNTMKNIVKAVLLVSFVRLISASIGGVLLWGSSIKYASEAGDNNVATKIFGFVNNNLILYSLFYNLIYILTTTILIIFVFFVTRKNLQIIVESKLESTFQ